MPPGDSPRTKPPQGENSQFGEELPDAPGEWLRPPSHSSLPTARSSVLCPCHPAFPCCVLPITALPMGHAQGDEGDASLAWHRMGKGRTSILPLWPGPSSGTEPRSPSHQASSRCHSLDWLPKVLGGPRGQLHAIGPLYPRQSRAQAESLS